MKRIKILIADDDPSILKLLSYNVKKLGYDVAMARDGEECLEELAQNEVATVLLDIQMPKMSGMQALEIIMEKHPNTTVIMVTARTEITTAVKAIKLGAFEYLNKPVDLERLATILRNAVDVTHLKKTVHSLNEKVIKNKVFSGVIGDSNELDKIFRQVQHVAQTTASVLIIGESGTGKELIARSVHKSSKRYSQPFVPVNCAAISHEISDSLIFGHKKGSFTGATEDRAGYFEQADKGTIFLDEIGDMSLDIQAKILRVLEERTVRRVGEKNELKVDFRLICATNKNLSENIENGTFREDLYYRLEEFPIYLPPLRKRKSDIPLLVNHFLKNYCEASDIPLKSFSHNALDQLIKHSWPGNIRELRNIVHRSAIRTTDNVIHTVIFSKKTLKTSPKLNTDRSTDLIEDANGGIKTFDEIEQEAIERAYKLSNQNAAEAAKLLQIGRATLYRKLKKYGLE